MSTPIGPTLACGTSRAALAGSPNWTRRWRRRRRLSPLSAKALAARPSHGGPASARNRKAGRSPARCWLLPRTWIGRPPPAELRTFAPAPAVSFHSGRQHEWSVDRARKRTQSCQRMRQSLRRRRPARPCECRQRACWWPDGQELLERAIAASRGAHSEVRSPGDARAILARAFGDEDQARPYR